MTILKGLFFALRKLISELVSQKNWLNQLSKKSVLRWNLQTSISVSIHLEVYLKRGNTACHLLQIFYRQSNQMMLNITLRVYFLFFFSSRSPNSTVSRGVHCRPSPPPYVRPRYKPDALQEQNSPISADNNRVEALENEDGNSWYC